MVSAIPAVASAPDRVAEPLDEVEEAMVEEEAPFLGAVLAAPSLRKSFSLKEKRESVRDVDAIVATGLSRRNACLQLGVPHGYYARFKKAIALAQSLQNSAAFLPYNFNGTARKIHPGPPSVLDQIKDDLIRFVFETRERGIQVSTRMIHQEASRLMPAFRNKTILAKDAAVLRFTKRLGLSIRAATHTAQKHFLETEVESQDFIAFIKAKIVGKDPCDVINMDQNSIPFSFHSNKTLEIKGARTVHVCASTADLSRFVD